MLDLYEELKAVVHALTLDSVDYALCGGLAMAVYHVPRATIDIDLLVPADHLAPAEASARRLGYVIEAKPMVPAGGEIEIRKLSKVDPDTNDLLSLDLVVVTSAVADAWETRQSVEWDEGVLTVVSREGLITMKAIRNSGQDRDDIRALEGQDAD